MSVDRSEIKLEIEVPGRPEEVWRAVATGPGISSWYVPHTVEEREGGAANASFGPGPEMQVAGRVAVWEPPRRVCFDGGEGVEGLAFEWSIEAIDDASCVVRLINTGFGQGDEWDAQYDAMTEGWRMFMFNLRLHLEHFSGQTATSALPMAMWAGPIETTWLALTDALGIPSAPGIGERIEVKSCWLSNPVRGFRRTRSRPTSTARSSTQAPPSRERSPCWLSNRLLAPLS